MALNDAPADKNRIVHRGSTLAFWLQINPTLAENELVIIWEEGKAKLIAGNGIDNFQTLLNSVGTISNSEPIPGPPGADGKSAFEVWQEIPGNENKTIADFQEDLVGKDGKSAYEVWLSAGNTGTVPEYLQSLKGADGRSAYEIWLAAGNTGTEADYIASAGTRTEPWEVGPWLVGQYAISGQGIYTPKNDIADSQVAPTGTGGSVWDLVYLAASQTEMNTVTADVSAIKVLIGNETGDPDNFINTVREVLTFMQNMAEGADLATLLAGKIGSSEVETSNFTHGEGTAGNTYWGAASITIKAALLALKAKIAGIFNSNNTWFGSNTFEGLVNFYDEVRIGNVDIYNIFQTKTAAITSVFFSTPPASKVTPITLANNAGTRYAETAAAINNAGSNVAIAAFNIDVPFTTAAGKERFDITVARYTGGTVGYERVAGVEGNIGAVAGPSIPPGTLFVRDLRAGSGSVSAGSTDLESRVTAVETGKLQKAAVAVTSLVDTDKFTIEKADGTTVSLSYLTFKNLLTFLGEYPITLTQIQNNGSFDFSGEIWTIQSVTVGNLIPITSLKWNLYKVVSGVMVKGADRTTVADINADILAMTVSERASWYVTFKLTFPAGKEIANVLHKLIKQ